MNNGDENHTELLTVHEIARLLKLPVSWVWAHEKTLVTFARDAAEGCTGSTWAFALRVECRKKQRNSANSES